MRTASGALGRRDGRAPGARRHRVRTTVPCPPVSIPPRVDQDRLLAVWCFLVALAGGLVGLVLGNLRLPRRAARRLLAGGRRGRQHRRSAPSPPATASIAHIRAGRINWRLFGVDGAAVDPRARVAGGYLSGVLPERRAAAGDRRGAPLQRRSSCCAGDRPAAAATRREDRPDLDIPRRGRDRRRDRPARRDRRPDPRLAAACRRCCGSSARRPQRAVGTNVTVGFCVGVAGALGHLPNAAPDLGRCSPRRRRLDPGRAARLAPHRAAVGARSSCARSASCCWSPAPRWSSRRSRSVDGPIADADGRRRSPAGDDRAAAAADPLRHGQPARQRARGAGVPARRARRGGLRLRAARRRDGAPEPPRAPARRARTVRRSATSATSTPCSPRRGVDARPLVRGRRRRLPVGPRRARHEVPGRGRGRSPPPRSRARAGGRRAASCWSCAWSTRRPAARFGAQFITEKHPDKVRCDYLLNEGGGGVFEYGGTRRYGVCCAEKGVFRFTLTHRRRRRPRVDPAHGRQRAAEARAAARAARRAPAGSRRGREPAMLRALGDGADDPPAAVERLRERDPSSRRCSSPCSASRDADARAPRRRST